jgi:hypothetical protein
MSADLIARLEAAESGSQELDALVIAHLIGGTALKSPRNGVWCVYLGVDRRGELRLWAPREERDAQIRRHLYSDAGGPTRSLDAALMLVPEGYAIRDFMIWPGEPSQVTLLETRRRPFGNDRRIAYVHDARYGRWEGNAATAPLALVIACLKARAHV